MSRRLGLALIVAALGVSTGADLFACGDKFLVVGRGTRYQRPKNARAASVLIYADPSSGLPATLKGLKADSALKQEGHRATTVQTREELTAILASGRFDVVLASDTVASNVSGLLGGNPAVLVPVDGRAKAKSLLEAIDKAVERHDQNVRKLRS